jgi:hypothetical protein
MIRAIPCFGAILSSLPWIVHAQPYGPQGVLGPSGALVRTCAQKSQCSVLSPTHPWQSVIQGARPGDTILLQRGFYDASGTVAIPAGSASAPITIANHNGEAVSIRGGFRLDSHTVIEGLTIDSPSSAYTIEIDSRTSTPRQGIEIKNLDVLGGKIEAIRVRGNVEDVTVRNSLVDGGGSANTIKIMCDDNSGYSGDVLVSCTYTPENIVITNNRISKVRSSVFPVADSADLLQLEGSGDVTVTYNEFGENAYEDCVDWKSQGRTGSSIVFSHNLINTCHSQGILIHQGQLEGSTVIEGNYFSRGNQLVRQTHGGTKIINNVIDGSLFNISAGHLIISYNTFLNSGNALKLGDSRQGQPYRLEVLNNIFSGTIFSCSSAGCGEYSAIRNITYQTDGSFTCWSCLSTDPMLSGYEIRERSSARDMASAASSVALDIAGTSRPQGPAPDIGAFEVIGGMTSLRACSAATGADHR